MPLVLDAEFIFKVFFEGVLFAQLVYVVLHLCVQTRRRDYLYYLLFLLSCMAYFLYKDFMFYQLGWKYGGYPYPHNGINYILANLMHLTYLKFVKHFIGTKEKYPVIHKIASGLRVFITLFICLNGVSILLYKTLVPPSVQYGYSAICGLVTFGLIIRMFQRRNTLIHYIIIGTLVYAIASVLSLVTAIAHVNGYLPGFGSSLTVLQVGVMLEVLCFTAALAYKSVEVEKEHNLSQQKLLQQLERNKALDAHLQQIRNKISEDLHDDIGATLTAISVYSDVAKKYHEQGNATGVMGVIQQMGNASRQMVQDMHDIIWMINPKNDELSAVVEKIQLFVSSLVPEKNIAFHLKVAQQVRELPLNMQIRRDLYLLMKEGINNAIKHADCRHLWVTLSYLSGQIILQIQDDGKGFDVEKSTVGNGLGNLAKRVRYHKGNIDIKSGPTGSTLTFSFVV